MALSGTLSGAAIREKFIQFFVSRHAHQHLPSASLIPSNPTVLLTPAGMLPFVPVFLGVEPPPSPPRVVSSQKCARVSGKASDLDFVGRTPRHHTFFEMLGNFSFGDYFKKEVIGYAWSFITEELKLPTDRLWVTIFQDDEESEELWQSVAGVSKNRIIKRGKKDNFWGPPGPTGPCGPCSEIFYDRGGSPEGSPESNADLLDTDRFVEIWNLVFMELFQDDAGVQTPLKQKNVDTGMGLERIAMVVQGKSNTFETDLLFPLVDQVSKNCKIPYKQNEQSDVALKIVADHVRCTCFAIADGITPSNDGRGYIIRMLIRRAVRYGKKYLGFNQPFLYQLVSTIKTHYQSAYPEVSARYKQIVDTIQLEEKRFFETLERGSKMLDELIDTAQRSKSANILGSDAFKLYDTYGFPLELTRDIAQESGLSVDIDDFETAMAEQRNKSRSARGKGKTIVQDQTYSRIFEEVGATRFVGYETLTAEATVKAILVNGESVDTASGTNQPFEAVLDVTPFYAESGGQVGDCGSFSVAGGHQGLTVVVNNTTKVGDLVVHHCLYDQGSGLKVGDSISAQVDSVARHQATIHHTSTHLLQAALRKILGDSVIQAGSHVSPEGARFDFTFGRSLSRDELNRVEFQINKWIQTSLTSQIDSLPIEDAKKTGALLMAGEKYGNTVRVVAYGEASKELCGGTHVAHLGEIALVKILSESAIASGIRRIEIIAGELAYKHFKQVETLSKNTADLLKVTPKEILERVERILAENKEREKTIKQLEDRFLLQEVKTLQGQMSEENPVLICTVDGYQAEGLKNLAQKLAGATGQHLIFMACQTEGKVLFVASLSKEFVAKGLKAGELVKQAAQICEGGGGGRPEFAQAGGKQGANLPQALEKIRELVSKQSLPL